ncbi:HK97 gp10 family phage protein [Azospirillum agricola]|uniref:HK97 gp10 family phage protein n=1 Tax=Azospirillum agricola TaxID=1720247 RepID=UPI000A0F064A|nr:HK97 gp10 family phage protein [Azospirillum agricola]SMH62843.1 Bacteriophage HK97-gp10, putative tail-component [Azospirillum lipoferum]
MATPSYGLAFDARAAAALARAPDIFLTELARGILEGQMLAEREVKERTPTSGAGTLRDSIGALPVQLSGDRVTGLVGTALAYAEPVELGSKPHMPPIEPLFDWVKRKLGLRNADDGKALGIARAIQWKIFHVGTKGAFMFRDTFSAIQPQLDAIMGAAALRAIHKVEGL